jgi:hypothetical protein
MQQLFHLASQQRFQFGTVMCQVQRAMTHLAMRTRDVGQVAIVLLVKVTLKAATIPTPICHLSLMAVRCKNLTLTL